MKRKVLLLVDADVETCAAALSASQSAGLDVRFAKIQRDLSEIAELGLDDVAAIVLDYDPDAHGLTIAEALDGWFPPRPLIFVSSDEYLANPLVLSGRAAEHLIKPVSSHRLAQAIESVVHDIDCRCARCDRWGHPIYDFENAGNRASKAHSHI